MAIYGDKIYFGNQNRMTWVRAPQINYEASRRGWYSTANFTNGGNFVRRSSTGSKGYVFSWTMKTRDEIRAITDYHEGVFGDGLIYFLEPFAMDKNLLPQYWATPSLGAGDAPLLIGETDDDRPGLIQTPTNSNSYPYNSAVYNLDGVKRVSQLWIPVPPNYTLWFGAHGLATGSAAVTVYPTTGPNTVGTPFNVTMMLATDQTRVTNSVDGNFYTGALLTFTGTGALTLNGLMAQVLPTGMTPPGGGFISGQGHSGCAFTEDPTITNYSAAQDKVGASVNLVEIGGWL